jgi:tetratricopeptide (TPR) repeat protein
MKMVWLTTVGVVTMAGGIARAQLAPPSRPVDPGSGPSAELASRAAEGLVRGNAQEALRLAEQAIAADDRNPWAHYDRAAALADLRRVDDAIAEFKVAEARFPAADPWGKSVAIYGRANILEQTRACSRAAAAFEEYARFVEPLDRGAAAMARQHAAACSAAPR